ncbi:hypothetical protein [Flavobacterium notoginsengisoli]|uniref:hypothetical protein n=1 Tax=Flavobacterium notoginsengisoli TaxID=1478199 RepID=UPI0036271CB0
MIKSLFYFLLALLITLSSCSSEEKNSDLILPQTINYIDIKTSTDSLVKVSYDGNKIKSLIGEGGRIEFEYEGDFIIKQTRYFKKEGKDVKNDEYSYSYKNDKLFLETHIEGSHKQTRLFTYNDNGTVDVKINSFYSNGQEREEKEEYTFVNGNLIKVTYNHNQDSMGELKFEYDTKSNPFKNVLGYKLLMHGSYSIFINNIVEVTSTDIFKGSVLNTRNYKTEYIYNNQGYPVKMTSNLILPNKIIEYSYK